MLLQAPNSHNPNAFVRSIASLNGLASDVSRDASQAQVVVQSAHAENGAQSQNALAENATLVQGGSAENSKAIAVAAPPSDPTIRTVRSPFLTFPALSSSTPLSLATFWGPTLSRGLGNINQGQGTQQHSVARGFDFDGNPSHATNTLVQNENTAMNLTSHQGAAFSLEPSPEPSRTAPLFLFSPANRLSPHQIALQNTRTLPPKGLASYVNAMV